MIADGLARHDVQSNHLRTRDWSYVGLRPTVRLFEDHDRVWRTLGERRRDEGKKRRALGGESD